MARKKKAKHAAFRAANKLKIRGKYVISTVVFHLLGIEKKSKSQFQSEDI
jgi:hypothetical protein